MSPNRRDGKAASARRRKHSKKAKVHPPSPPNGQVPAAGGGGNTPDPLELSAEPLDFYKTINLAQVRQEEGKVIKKRRERVWGTAKEISGETFSDSSKNDSLGLPQDLVGLALSGGGVRSSMFNTGVLQGLDKIGLLKHVDYLATVSGGGFIGGYFTAKYNRNNKRETRSPLAEDEGGRNSSVNQLTRNGGYLSGPVELTLRLAAGVTLHLLIIASLLILGCSFLSWFWRIPDMSRIQRFLADASTRADLAGWRGYAWAALIISGIYAIYYLPHLWPRRRLLERKLSKLERLGEKLLACGLIVLASLAFVAFEGGFFAVYRDWFGISDLVRAFIMLGVVAYGFGFLGQMFKASSTASNQPSTWLTRVVGIKNLALVFGLFLSLLTLLANGDTALGPRIGQAVNHLFPSLGQEMTNGSAFVQMRNSQTFRQWLATIIQGMLFIQVCSGIVPLLLPRQFASSGQAGAGSLHRGAYRSIIFLLFISLPLVICFLFLRENISGAVQIPSPIKRLAVSRDPVTGMYGYLIDHDQWTRFRWFLAGFLAFVALDQLVDLNRTSLHQYYRRRLKSAYFDAFPDGDPDPSGSDALPETRLRDINVGESGAPYPLLVATMNEIRPGSISLDSGCAFIFAPLYCGWSRNQPLRALRKTDQVRKTSDRSDADPPEHQSCFIKTEAYGAKVEKKGPDKSPEHGAKVEKEGPDKGPGLRLVDAMAISGAAITPSNSHSVLDTILMLAVNARLGQWLVNPGAGTKDAPDTSDKERDAPDTEDQKALEKRSKIFQQHLEGRGHGIPSISPWRLMRSVLQAPGPGREFCFLSDGAHYDNLGMEVLFERRCRLIIASDASHDPHYEFGDLSKTLRRLRAFWGIEFFLDRKAVEGHASPPDENAVGWIPWDLLDPKDFSKDGAGVAAPSKKTAAETPLCRSHHLVLAFRYPDTAVFDKSRRWGLLVVLKPSLDGEENRTSPGLFSYARLKTPFPMDDDMNQFFDENQCEYYRALGEHVAASILEGGISGGPGQVLNDIATKIRKPRARFDWPLALLNANAEVLEVGNGHP